ncbi:Mitochondrial-processing peptidase subunit alpha [Parahypoxylon ruwenzoriense]
MSGDGDRSRHRSSHWPSLEKRPSSPISFGRRLTRKHYCVGLAVLLVIMLFLANPYHPLVDVHRLKSSTGSSESQPHIVSVSLPTSSPTAKVSSSQATNAVEPKPESSQKQQQEEEEKEKNSAEKPTEKQESQEDGNSKPQEKKPADEPNPEPEEPAEKAAADSSTDGKPNTAPADADYCTTWPVEAKVPYKPKPKPKPAQALQLDSYGPPGGWRKPSGVKAVAMVFYGRKRNVDILDCYLRQNLASNGGYLDEVWFMVHTEVKDDVDWLRDMAKHVPGYKFVDLGPCTTEPYGCIWEYAVEDDTIYIKIDDDILYIHHDAIPQLIHTRLAQPHPYAVSAQLVNSPVTGLQQYHYGAIHPFLPDPKPRAYRAAAESWRPSEYGLYPPATRPLDGNPLDVAPSYSGHPWLLLSNSSRDSVALRRTPMASWNGDPGPDPIAFGPAWKSWGAAAQQLYSLLRNLEENRMDRYHFGRALDYTSANETSSSSSSSGSSSSSSKKYEGPGGEALYDMQYERYNLNFVAVWGRDVAAGLPIHDDELEITAEIPARLGRPFVIDTRAVVAHQSFFTQRDGIGRTDLMDRWRAFANENVCAADNQKTPWDLRCEGY